MPSLPELQRAFAQDLHNQSAAASAQWISEGRFTAERLFKVYQNNYTLSLSQALADTHPTVDLLLGADFFRQVARGYLESHRSHHGNLHEFGEGFADYLTGLEVLEPHAYLPDVARLDWLCHRVFHAADSQPLSGEELALLPAERYGEARFGFVPASGLLGSDYPLVKLREFALGGDNGNDPPDIHDNPQSVLVARKDYEISLWPLSQAEFVFLGTLKIEQTLGNAVERAIECDESFNLNDTLSRCFHSGVLQDWHLPEDQ